MAMNMSFLRMVNPVAFYNSSVLLLVFQKPLHVQTRWNTSGFKTDRKPLIC